jgi:hypothetical protein
MDREKVAQPHDTLFHENFRGTARLARAAFDHEIPRRMRAFPDATQAFRL